MTNEDIDDIYEEPEDGSEEEESGTEVMVTFWVAPDGNTTVSVHTPEDFDVNHAIIAGRKIGQIVEPRFIQSVLQLLREGEVSSGKPDEYQAMIQSVLEANELSGDDPHEDVVPVLEDEL